MSNDIANFAASAAVNSVEDLDAAMAEGDAHAPTSTSGETYMRMGKDGIWVYGADNVEVQENSNWAINIFELAHGWVAWGKDGSPQAGTKLGETMGPANKPAPPYGNPDFPWTTQVGFPMVCLNGEDVGVQTAYYASSKGGINAYNEVRKEVKNRPSHQHPVPIVVLESDSYTHKQYGKQYTPIFKVVDWADLQNGLLSAVKGAIAAPPADAKPAGRAAVAEAAPAEEAPTSEAPAEQAEEVAATEAAAPDALAAGGRRRRRGAA